MKHALLILAALGSLPVVVQAQQTTLCTSLITDNPSNPYTDGIVAISETFPVEGSGDYASAWKAHIDRKYPTKIQRVSQCSAPVPDPATAAQGRGNFIQKWQAGFKTDLEPWRPTAGVKAAAGSGAEGSARENDAGRHDQDVESAGAVGQGTQRAGNATSGAARAASGGGTGQRPICATQPFPAPNTAFPKGSAVKITNTCREPLSVRICLRIEGKWDCGVNFGVQPGADWSWGSTKIYTGWFWDARLASSGDRLGHPEE